MARYLFKLMAYKDEYEVARLYTDGTFAAELARKFKGPYRLSFISRRRFSPSATRRPAICASRPSVPG